MNRCSSRSQRLLEDLATLDWFGRDDAGGFTRLAWSPELSAAIKWVGRRMREAGLVSQIAPGGNLIRRWEVGTDKAVLVGPRLDAVTSSGVSMGPWRPAALEAVWRLRDQGFWPGRP